MADDQVLHYLPQGWTEERYKNATDDDWDSLTEEEAKRMMQRAVAKSKIQSAANMTRINKERAARGAPPMHLPSDADSPSATSFADVESLVQVVESAGHDDFGFVLIRTFYGRNSDALFEQFQERWSDILTSRLDQAPESAGFARIEDKLFIKIVDDDIISGSGPEQVALAYRLFLEADDGEEDAVEIESGLRMKMCLMVDEGSMRSVTEKKEGTVPYVTAVDARLGDEGNLDYPGFFRVAIEALATQLYPALSESVDPCQLFAETQYEWEDCANGTRTWLGKSEGNLTAELRKQMGMLGEMLGF